MSPSSPISSPQSGGSRKRRIDELQRLSVDDFRASEKIAIDVVLDNVRSLFNVGSIFRTADAFRLRRLHLCGITACPPHPEIHKTALGAEISMDWQHHDSALHCVRLLQAEGYTVLALEQAEGSMLLPASLLPSHGEPLALVVGHEVHGVQQEVVDACDGCLEIPQFGTKHSLNVACAAAIAIWELVRGRLPMPPPPSSH